MAFRKETFIALKKKHKNTPKIILEKVADHLEKGINEETEVEPAVEGSEGLVASLSEVFQSETDRRVNEALAKKGIDPDADPDGDEEGKGSGKTKTNDDQVPAWAKGLVEANKSLLAKIETLEQGKVTDSRKTALEAALKDAPESFKTKTLRDFSRMKFETDEDFNAYLDETDEDLKAFSQEQSNSGLSQQQKPFLGNPNHQGVSASVQAYIDSKANPDKSGDNMGGKKI